MAFSGFNVTFGVMMMNSGRTTLAPIYGPSVASNNMASAGTSSVAAAEISTPAFPYAQQCVASVYSSADAWMTIGPIPADPSADTPTGGRRFVPAATAIDFLCLPGDKVRWSPA